MGRQSIRKTEICRRSLALRLFILNLLSIPAGATTNAISPDQAIVSLLFAVRSISRKSSHLEGAVFYLSIGMERNC